MKYLYPVYADFQLLWQCCDIDTWEFKQLQAEGPIKLGRWEHHPHIPSPFSTLIYVARRSQGNFASVLASTLPSQCHPVPFLADISLGQVETQRARLQARFCQVAVWSLLSHWWNLAVLVAFAPVQNRVALPWQAEVNELQASYVSLEAEADAERSKTQIAEQTLQDCTMNGEIHEVVCYFLCNLLPHGIIISNLSCIHLSLHSTVFARVPVVTP